MGLQTASVMPTIGVEDLDRAISFYSDRLGFTVTRLTNDPTSALVGIGKGGRLLLYQSSFPRGETTAAAILVDDVPGCVSELRERGVTFEDYDLPGLKTENGIATLGELQSAWFKDSEGNTLAITTETAEVMSEAA